jgi:hypothetical protein
MTRVLEGRVGDRGRKSTLYALANYAGPDGRHTYPSIDTLAHDAECSTATIRRDLRELVKAGWIRRGDQAHVAHIRGDRRPVVYDIAMNEETRLAWISDVEGGGSDDTAGEKASPPGSSSRPVSLTPRDGGPDSGTTSQPDTPSLDPTGCQIDAHGVSKTASRGVTAVTPEPYEPFEPKPPLPPASGGRPSSTCQKPGPTPHVNCRGCGTTTRDVAKAAAIAAADAKRAKDRDELQAAREAKAAAQAAAAESGARTAALEKARREVRDRAAGDRRTNVRRKR